MIWGTNNIWRYLSNSCRICPGIVVGKLNFTEVQSSCCCRRSWLGILIQGLEIRPLRCGIWRVANPRCPLICFLKWNNFWIEIVIKIFKKQFPTCRALEVNCSISEISCSASRFGFVSSSSSSSSSRYSKLFKLTRSAVSPFKHINRWRFIIS